MGATEICMQETGKDWVIEMDLQAEDDERLNEKEKGEWEKYTIYKLRKGFYNENRTHAYKPQIVSLGPYHHGEDQLLAMEEHKRRALRHYLVRTKKSITDYHKSLKDVAKELMDSYRDLGSEWKDDEERFLRLMIFDGCFLMEVMGVTDGSIPEYDEKDPIFSRHGLLCNVPRIGRDMLLIENQIPLLVLRTLLSVQNNQKQPESLNREVNKMVLAFYGLAEEESREEEDESSKTTANKPLMEPLMQKQSSKCSGRKEEKEKEKEKEKEVELGLHVLDVVRKDMIKGISKVKTSTSEGNNEVIWPATQLQKAGIKFRKNETRSLKDISFRRGWIYPTLILPPIEVDDATESKLLNLMAFEQLHTDAGFEVSSYACFMDNIIDTEEDVSLLCENEIIKNFVGTDKTIAELFNGLSHDVTVDPGSDPSAVKAEVIEHCKNCWHKNLAYLKINYFKNPWSAIALFAGSLALVITIVQFVYSMLNYYS